MPAGPQEGPGSPWRPDPDQGTLLCLGGLRGHLSDAAPLPALGSPRAAWGPTHVCIWKTIPEALTPNERCGDDAETSRAPGGKLTRGQHSRCRLVTKTTLLRPQQAGLLALKEFLGVGTTARRPRGLGHSQRVTGQRAQRQGSLKHRTLTAERKAPWMGLRVLNSGARRFGGAGAWEDPCKRDWGFIAPESSFLERLWGPRLVLGRKLQPRSGSTALTLADSRGGTGVLLEGGAPGRGRAVLETPGPCQPGRGGGTEPSAPLRGPGLQQVGPLGTDARRGQAARSPRGAGCGVDSGPLHRPRGGASLSLGRPGGRELAGGVPHGSCHSLLQEGTSQPVAAHTARILLPRQMSVWCCPLPSVLCPVHAGAAAVPRGREPSAPHPGFF